ncbi:nSTAND1 domain-containing NTPase [Nitrospira sp. M1]
MSDQTLDTALTFPENPFPGIAPFSYASRHVFFSREDESKKLIRLIVMYRAVLLYSASGTGKSSLINAGLIPRAIEEGFQPERVRVQPRFNEEIVISRIAIEEEGRPPFRPSIFTTEEFPKVVLSVDDFVKTLLQESSHTPPLIIFDQFEEWSTLFKKHSTDKEVGQATAPYARVLMAIGTLLNNRECPFKLLFAFREDYLAQLTPLLKQCPDLPDHYLRLEHLKSSQIYQAIRGPFELKGRPYRAEFSQSLAKKIQSQFQERSEGGDVRLPEVQIVCSNLYEKGKTCNDFEQIFQEEGEVKGILEQHLEQALASLEIHQQTPAVYLLMDLLTPDGTRNVVEHETLLKHVDSDLENGPKAISRELLELTLKSLDHDLKLIRREVRGEKQFWEISSEFLVPWIRRKDQERRERIEKKKLDQAEEDAKKEGDRAELLRQHKKMAIVAAVGMLALFLAACVMFVIALNAKQKAIEAKQEAIVSDVVAETRVNIDVDPELSILLAQEAVKLTELREPYDIIKRKASDALRLAIQSSQVRYTLPKADEWMLTVAWGRDEKGKLLATGSYDNSVNVWEIVSETPALELKRIATFAHTDRVNAVAFSPDGHWLAIACGDGEAKVWKLASKDLRYTTGQGEDGHKNSVTDVEFNADGSLLATASKDNTVKVWEFDAEVPKSQLEQLELKYSFDDEEYDGHTDRVNAVAFSPTTDKKWLATASHDATIKVWDVESGSLLHTLKDPDSSSMNWIYDVAFKEDSSRLATAGKDGMISIWKEGLEGNFTLLRKLAGHRGRVYSVDFGPDERLISGSFDGTAKLWDTESCTLLGTFSGHLDRVRGVAFSPDGTHVSTASWDNSAKIWSTRFNEDLLTIDGHVDEVNRVIFSPNEKYMATASTDTTAKVWEVESGNVKYTLDEGDNDGQTHTKSVNALAFSPDGRLLATGSSDATAKVWDMSSGERTISVSHEVTDGTGSVNMLAFSSDGNYLATASSDATAKIWEVSSGDMTVECVGEHDKRLNAVAFSPDGKFLVTGGKDDKAVIWKWDTSSCHKHKLFEHNTDINAVTFSPVQHGLYVAIASDDGTTLIWDAETENTMPLDDKQDFEVRDVVFNGDGSRLATAMSNGEAKVWERDIKSEGYDLNKKSYKLLGTFTGHADRITSLAFSPDSHVLATASLDHTVRLITLDSNRLKELANARKTRSKLTEKECGKYKTILFDHCEPILLVARGDDMAKAGHVTAAIEIYRAAQALDDSLQFNHEKRAKKIAKIGELEKKRSLSKAGYVNTTKVSHQNTNDLIPTLDREEVQNKTGNFKKAA